MNEMFMTALDGNITVRLISLIILSHLVLHLPVNIQTFMR